MTTRAGKTRGSTRLTARSETSAGVQLSDPQLVQDTALALYFSNTTPSSTPATFDEFALYDRALTPSEVAARFALGTP